MGETGAAGSNANRLVKDGGRPKADDISPFRACECPGTVFDRDRVTGGETSKAGMELGATRANPCVRGSSVDNEVELSEYLSGKWAKQLECILAVWKPTLTAAR